MPPPTPPSPAVEFKPAASIVVPETKLAGGGEYTVQAGDSLSVIARRCHVTQAELIEANKLKDPNKIRIGQKLILPATGQCPAVMPKSAATGKAKSTPIKAAVVTEVLASGGEYVVKPGDNLSKIAARHGVKTSALREANKLQSDKLKIAQKLIIPGAEKAISAEVVVPAVVAPAPFDVDGENVLLKPAAAPEVRQAEVTLPLPAAKDAEVVLVPAASGTTSTLSGSGLVHTVVPTDTLSELAKTYTVTVDEILELNQLPSNHSIQVGERLKIP